MQVIQLFIGTDQVELFKDESVTITQSIKNAKDIDKVFTEFTQSFTVPASKANNKIFKHFYNFNITSGFDGRKKVDATIELNHIPFKKGKIKLEGVDLKNNKPYAYRITFFGNTVDLKDLLGEDKLDALNFLDNFTQDYDSSSVKTKLQAGADVTVSGVTSTDVIITPLIAHNRRLFFDSSASVTGSANLSFSSGQNKGVLWSDLKYAIRVQPIIKAIETKYSLTFSTDFFNTSNARFYNLYLWMQRKQGNLVEDVQEFTSQVSGFAVVSGGTYVVTSTSSLAVQRTISSITLTTVVSDTSKVYDVLIFRNGALLTSLNGQTGNKTNVSFSGFVVIDDGTLTVFVRCTSALNFTTFRLTFDEIIDSSAPTEQIISASSATISTTISFIPTQQVPEIKVIDFLTGLFKLFNLVAFVNDSGTIVVKDLDSFYSGGTTYDISEFVDVTTSQVNVALPYKEIIFKFKGTKSLLASKFNQLNNREWGSLEYNNEENLDGALYKVEAPFEHMQYERLQDGVTGNIKNVQVGYMIDENENPIKGEPLLFYAIFNNSSPQAISFLTDSTTVVSIPDGSNTGYYIPSNSVSLDDTSDDTALHYGLEVNEWNTSGTFDGTLFEDLYKDYIQDIFNSKNRISKVRAFLPQKIFYNLTLADRFVIGTNKYKINSITTNLLTGESNIELINEL